MTMQKKLLLEVKEKLLEALKDRSSEGIWIRQNIEDAEGEWR
ncbi:MAG: hypothetical protein QXU63_02860 [Nitrososphaerota archaeon]